MISKSLNKDEDALCFTTKSGEEELYSNKQIFYFMIFIPSLSAFDSLKDLHFPDVITPEVAEIVGLMIGDGHLAYNKDKRGYVFQLYGDFIKERLFYDMHIHGLFQEAFSLNIKPRYIHKSVYGYQFMSKALVLFFHKNFSIPLGKKCDVVRMPHFNSKELQLACLRGLIDADFGIVSGKERPILQGWFCNKNLVADISRTLETTEIQHSVSYDQGYLDKRTKKFYNRHRIAISKKSEIDKWYNIIGTGHPIMKMKYLCWKTNHTLLKDADILNILALERPNSGAQCAGVANVV